MATTRRAETAPGSPGSIVRSFSHDINATGPEDDLSRALVAKVDQDEALEKQKTNLPNHWQDLFYPDKLSANIGDIKELRELDRISRELAQKWKKLQDYLPEGQKRSQVDEPPPCWADLKAAVVGACEKLAHDRKDTKTGRAKVRFEKVCGTFHSYSSLFAIIPSGDKYVSLLTGSLSAIVKASIRHAKVIEEVESLLEDLFDSIDIWRQQWKLHPGNQDILPIAAKLYTAVFIFLLDLMNKWLGRSSWKRFVESFSTGLEEKLQKAKSTISSLSERLDTVGRLASDAYIQRIPTREDWTTGLLPQLGASVTELLRYQQAQFEARLDASLEARFMALADAPSSMRNRIGSSQDYSKDDIVGFASRWHGNRQDKAVAELLGRHWDASIGQEMFQRLTAWYKSPESNTLWVMGPAQVPTPSRVTLTSAFMLKIARNAGISTIAYYCHVQRLVGGTSQDALISFIYSLLVQAIDVLPSNFHSVADFTSVRFEALDETLSTLEKAISLLEDLLKSGPGSLFCIIDSTDKLWNTRANRPWLAKVVTLLNSPITRHGSNEAIMRKTLFTTDGFSDAFTPLSHQERFDLRNFEAQPQAGAPFGARSLTFF